MTQCDAIAAYLRSGGSLTPLDALRMFGCLALSQRCGELRRRGLPVVSEMVKVGAKRVARYRMENAEAQIEEAISGKELSSESSDLPDPQTAVSAP